MTAGTTVCPDGDEFPIRGGREGEGFPASEKKSGCKSQTCGELRRLSDELCGLVSGECYVFSMAPNMQKGGEEVLWAIYYRREHRCMILEAATFDLVHYSKYTALPAGFDYVREMTRDELRDFHYNLGFTEAIASARSKR